MEILPDDPKYSVHKPFKSDGCSWFPDLWIQPCCKNHDYATWAGHDQFESDVEFMRCIATKSKFLGIFAFGFAALIVTGMAIGRPIRNFVIKISMDFNKTE